jgi:acyl phosphate:glycerol-3-phosphate acyltransferase
VSDLALTLLAYLIGSVPTGVVVGRFVGIDVRAVGSGNIGATNVTRAAGNTAGLVTLIADVGKGAAAVALARAFGTSAISVPAAVLAAPLGHIFSVFLRFSGGKGVATGLGSCLVLAPAATIPSVLVFAATCAATRIVSVASLAGAWTIPISMFLADRDLPSVAAVTLLAMVITVRHRDNIRRIRARVEPRFGDRPSPPEAGT